MNSASLLEECSKLQRHFARTESKNRRDLNRIRHNLNHSGAARFTQPAHRSRDDPSGRDDAKLARGKRQPTQRLFSECVPGYILILVSLLLCCIPWSFFCEKASILDLWFLNSGAAQTKIVFEQRT